MRIFLTVLRNCLPTTEVVWALPDSDTANGQFTIAKFLAQVNESIPLESEEWGLEDYVVEVGGYECIHYQSARRLLSEDDQVVIRPLETSDIRARHVGGRSQISAGGMHLVDGIPFGRERGTGRPAIQIPSRKRARDLPDVLNDPQDFIQSSEELYQDFEVEERLLLTNGVSDEADLPQPRKKQRMSDSHVRFDDSAMQMEENEDDEEDDDYEEKTEEEDEDEEEEEEEEENGESGSEEDVDEEDSSDSSDSDSSDDESDSDESVESESEESSDTDSSEGESEDDSEEASESEEEQKTVAPKSKASVKKSTDIQQQKSHTIKPEAVEESKVSDKIPEILPGSGKNETKSRNQRRKIAKRIKELIENGELPPNATREDLERYEEGLIPKSTIETSQKRSLEVANDQSLFESVDEVSPKRPKFDMGPATRLIYGSLGVRTPKSEKEALQVAEQLRQRNSRVSVTTPQELNNVPPESDAWRSKISLSAIDCNTDQWLEPAPYPCPPGWRSYPIEDGVDALDYDEVEMQQHRDYNSWPHNGVKDNEVNWESSHNLPVTEKEFENLPDAQRGDYRPGAIIAFRIMEMSAATNFQPNISSYRSAIITKVIDSESIKVKYARRDNVRKDNPRNARAKRVEQLLGLEEDNNGTSVVWIPNLINPKLIASASNLPEEEPVTLEKNVSVASDAEQEERNSSNGDDGSDEERNTSSEEDDEFEKELSENEASDEEDVESNLNGVDLLQNTVGSIVESLRNIRNMMNGFQNTIHHINNN